MNSIASWGKAPADLRSARNVLARTQQAAEITSLIYTLRLHDEFVERVRSNPDQLVPEAMEFVAHRLVEMMCGEIAVESRPNSGSNFWFSVPSRGARTPSGNSADSTAVATTEAPLLEQRRAA